jgi:2-keto-4-pentenoate hydratase/2-oxohepta-3-ene-1,7-dioic acid hydratase in catechol pathway
VQKGHTADMIFSADQIIAYVSKFMTLKTGDLIYTGTPSGVGPVKIGDRLEGYIGSEKMFSFSVK